MYYLSTNTRQVEEKKKTRSTWDENERSLSNSHVKTLDTLFYLVVSNVALVAA